jgi:hypothetical protein
MALAAISPHRRRISALVSSLSNTVSEFLQKEQVSVISPISTNRSHSALSYLASGIQWQAEQLKPKDILPSSISRYLDLLKLEASERTS